MVDAKSEIQSAVDSATLAAVSNSSRTRASSGIFDGDWTEAQAKKEALDIFEANFPKTDGYKSERPDLTITRSGLMLTAAMTARVTVPNTFMAVAGTKSNVITVSSVASTTLSPYIDVYVLTDNTPSMALGATPADIKEMERKFGCAFACHDLSYSGNTYEKAVAAKIPLRLDATREALEKLVPTIAEATDQDQQYRIAGYNFGSTIENRSVANFIPLTANLDKAASAASALTIMTIPWKGYNNQMATDLAKVMSEMTDIVGKAGTGATKINRQKLVLMITDGVNTTMKPSECPIPLNGYGQCQSPIDPKWCDKMKANGVSIGILYTTYYPVTSDGWYNEFIKPIQPRLGEKLAACATPNLFAEVQPHQGIAEGLQLLFKKYVAAPRLTN
jgi:hypothetical protein